MAISSETGDGAPEEGSAAGVSAPSGARAPAPPGAASDAARALIERTGAEVVLAADVDEPEGRLTLVTYRPGEPPKDTTRTLGEIATLATVLRRGRTLAIGDMRQDAAGNSERVPPDEVAWIVPQDLRAVLIVPRVADGRLVGIFLAGATAPRQWSGSDIAEAERSARATWAAAAWDGARDSEQFESALFDQLGTGFCVVEIVYGPDGAASDYRFVHVNPAFERQTGLVDPLGRTARELVPELEDIWIERYAQVAEDGVPLRFEEPSEPLGRWFSVDAFPIGPAGTRRVGILFTDITARRRTERALHESEMRMRHVIDSAVEYAIITIDLGRRITGWNSGAERLLGYSEREAIGMEADVFFAPEDRENGEPEAEMARAVEVGRAENERWHVRSDGTRFWGSGVMLPLRGDRGEAAGQEGGRPLGFLKIFRDRTDERQNEERRRLLLGELNHRVKNTLATVVSIAERTMQGHRPISQERAEFRARLIALSEVHNVLTEEDWTGAGLRDVALGALAPHGAGGRRFAVEGPNLRLSPRAALSLGMAFHELAANAAKHGALSRAGGTVRLSWHGEPEAAPTLARLRWQESGGPVVGLPERRGYGSLMLERGLGPEIGGAVSLHYHPEGFVCTMELLLSSDAGEGRGG